MQPLVTAVTSAAFVVTLEILVATALSIHCEILKDR